MSDSVGAAAAPPAYNDDHEATPRLAADDCANYYDEDDDPLPLYACRSWEDAHDTFAELSEAVEVREYCMPSAGGGGARACACSGARGWSEAGGEEPRP